MSAEDIELQAESDDREYYKIMEEEYKRLSAEKVAGKAVDEVRLKYLEDLLKN
jgi:hypothetical protein